MKKIRYIFSFLRERVKYSATNPKNFEVQWSFTASRLQLISFLTITSLVIGFLMTLILLSSPLAGYFGTDDVSIERSRLERQDKEITRLNRLVAAQEKYARSMRTILLGKEVDEPLDTLVPEVVRDFSSEINTDATKEEIELAQKVKDDLRPGKRKRVDHQQLFIAPLTGKILNAYNPLKQEGLTISAKKDSPVVSCLAGTIVYAGFSLQEGYVIIIEHADGYVSTYKHAKALLKKQGDKVQVSDPIAIVGAYGARFKEPHIQFELWLNQTSVNPQEYIRF